MKIAVVDDGIDPDNPFFSPQGFSYPAGFPKGGTKWTTPKIIVARAFVGAGADSRSSLAVDPQVSFHGTHVAGIAAGNAATTATAGRDHPRTSGLHGVAPRAQIGNYRVFNVPTPVGHVGNTAEIIAAFESAVRDGMDVINFSGGGPQTDPQSDALVEAVRNVAAAGVVPVISSGNDRDQYGLGTAGSPGSAPDAISVAALSNSQVFAPALRLVAPDAPPSLTRVPFLGAAGSTAPNVWGSGDQQLVDIGTIVGVNGTPVARKLCGPPGNIDGGPHAASRRVAPRRDRARVARRLHVRAQGRPREGGGRHRHRRRRQPAGRGERDPDRAGPARRHDRRPGRHPAARLPRDARRPRADQGRQRPARPRHGSAQRRHELLLQRAHCVRPPAQARRRGAREARSSRPRSSPRAAPSPSSTARAWRRRTSPARRPCCSSATRRGRRCRSSPLSSRLPAPRGRTRRAPSRRRWCCPAPGSRTSSRPTIRSSSPIPCRSPTATSTSRAAPRPRRCSSVSSTPATAQARGRSR